MPKRPSPQKRACDACHHRKIQCSFPSTDGPCEWCIHRSLECTFTRERPRKKPRGSLDQGEVSSLSQRIEQLEDALAQASPARESTNRDLTGTEEPTQSFSSSWRERAAISESPLNRSGSVAVPSPNIPREPSTKQPQADIIWRANQLGPNWFFNGIPMYSEAGRQWMSARTNQKVSLEDFCIPMLEPTAISTLSFSSHSESCILPDQSITQVTLSLYFRSSSRLAFPILDQALMEHTIQMAYSSAEDGTHPIKRLSAKACVLAAVSIVSCFYLTPQIAFSIDSHTYAAEANSLLMHIAGDVSLETVQTNLLLQLGYMFQGHWQKASVLNSMACSAICSLGGHIQPKAESPDLECPIETRHTRLLFWVSYIFDKEISLRTGNPPLLTDTYCELSMPDNFADYRYYLPDSPEQAESNDSTIERFDSYFPLDPRLSMLKEKVCRQLFSAQASKNDNNQLLLNIRQLDDEIERWRLSIPVGFRPALFVSRRSSPNTPNEATSYFIRHIFLQLEYHHLMTVIHTSVRKCTPDAGDGYQDLHHVVHSSFDLSLEASRSTLWCIRDLCTLLTEKSIRLMVSYPTTAALSLFLNILIHPLDSTAQLDLETLISVANAVRTSPVHDLRLGDQRSQETSDFIMRLVWLGTCAVTTASREKRAS